MVSRQERMRQKCAQYLERDLRGNLKLSQLLLEKPFLGVLVTSDEQVFALGADANDYFGLGPVTEIPKLTKIDSLCGKKIRQFAVYGGHILALSEGGVVYSWGNNEYGQLGNNSTTNSPVPIVVAGDLEHEVVTQIECAFNVSVALTEDGKVFTWGQNQHGGTGQSTTSGVFTFPKVVDGLLRDETIIKITCNQVSVLCQSQRGKVFGFGWNAYGNLGINNTDNQDHPVLIKMPHGQFVKDITSGEFHTLAVTDSGVLFAWGYNKYGQLGTGNQTNGTLPSQIRLKGDTSDNCKITRILAESNTSFAMDDNENVYVWGQVNGETVLHPTKRDIAFPETSGQLTSPPDRGSDLVSDLLNSFDNKASSDFVINVEGQDIHVHKTILQIRSRYFETMFNNDWKETECGKVVIGHYPYDVYYEFLRYLYCGTLRNLEPEQCMRLMDLATMALDDGLAKKCEKQIKRQLTMENLLSVFSAALLLEKEKLVDFCVRRFESKGMNKVIDSAAFEEIPAEHVRDFIRKCRLKGAFETK